MIQEEDITVKETETEMCTLKCERKFKQMAAENKAQDVDMMIYKKTKENHQIIF